MNIVLPIDANEQEKRFVVVKWLLRHGLNPKDYPQENVIEKPLPKAFFGQGGIKLTLEML